MGDQTQGLASRRAGFLTSAGLPRRPSSLAELLQKLGSVTGCPEHCPLLRLAGGHLRLGPLLPLTGQYWWLGEAWAPGTAEAALGAHPGLS